MPKAAAQAMLQLVSGDLYRLLIQFQPGPLPGDLVTYRYAYPPITVNDSGRDGDLTAGDKVYSALITLTPAEVAKLRPSLRPAADRRSSRLLGFQGRLLSRTALTTEASAAEPFAPASMADEGKVVQLTPETDALSDDEFAERVLMITDLGVIESASRVFDPGWPESNPAGVWAFKTLLERLVAAKVDSQGQEVGIGSTTAEALVLAWLETFAAEQVINGDTVPARAGARDFIDAWKQLNSVPNLSVAPFRLLGIFVRPDIVGGSPQLIKGDAGEARFVFGALDPTTHEPLPFTVILEYAVNSTTPGGVQQWFAKWRELASYPAGSAEHLERLQELTEIFTKPSATGQENTVPVRSWLSQVRTNEAAFGERWELREWILTSEGGNLRLKPTDVKQTPANLHRRTPRLAQFVRDNAGPLSQNPPSHSVPLQLPDGTPFRAGASRVFLFNGTDPADSFWVADGIGPELGRARLNLSLNSCNACHAIAETKTDFTHVGDRGRRALHLRPNLSPLLRSSAANPLLVRDPAQLIPDSEKPAFAERTFRRRALEVLSNPSLFQIFHTPTGGVH